MSAGTVIIQRALGKLGAHSEPAPAAPESISFARDVLNGMLQEWESRCIRLGTVPLDAPGDELSEPIDARNAIIENLAVRLYPDFPSIADKTYAALRVNAALSYDLVCKLYQEIEIPKRGVSSTMPMGSGNTKGWGRRVFAGKNATVDP